MEKYRQCLLEQGTARQVAWIPERGARLGVLVELKDGSGLWKVRGVWGRATREVALAYQDAYRTQREASDV